MFTRIRQTKYQNLIKDLLLLPDSENKIATLLDVLTKYYEFCYKNGLSHNLPFDYDLEKLFIIESTPEMPSEFPNVARIVNDLKDALKVNKEEGLIKF